MITSKQLRYYIWLMDQIAHGNSDWRKKPWERQIQIQEMWRYRYVLNGKAIIGRLLEKLERKKVRVK